MNLSGGTSAEGGWGAQQDAWVPGAGRHQQQQGWCSRGGEGKGWRAFAPSCLSAWSFPHMEAGGVWKWGHWHGEAHLCSRTEPGCFSFYLPFPPSPGAARAVGSDQLLRRLVISLKDTWKSSAATPGTSRNGKGAWCRSISPCRVSSHM